MLDPEISGLAKRATPIAFDGEFPQVEIPITEMVPLVKVAPNVTCIEAVPCPETNVVFVGSVHWYDEQPEIGRMEYVATLEVPLMVQTELTDCVNTGRVDIGDNFG